MGHLRRYLPLQSSAKLLEPDGDGKLYKHREALLLNEYHRHRAGLCYLDTAYPSGAKSKATEASENGVAGCVWTGRVVSPP